MKQKDGFVLRDVCGDKVIVGEGLAAIDFGKLLSLNETAAWLWQKAADQGEFSVDSLASALCEEYEVSPEKAKSDVTNILARWQEMEIVE